MRVLFDNGTPRGVAAVFVTTDRNIRHQQNLTGRKIAIVVLGKARWRLIKTRLPEIAGKAPTCCYE